MLSAVSGGSGLLHAESENLNAQAMAQKIRTTLVELLNVARMGELHATARHLENAIAEVDRVAEGGGTASQSRQDNAQRRDK